MIILSSADTGMRDMRVEGQGIFKAQGSLSSQNPPKKDD